jgi:hypothetical protein
MRRLLTALAVGVVWVVTAIPAQAAGGGPPFQAGPKGGDQFTYTSADPSSGEVSILQLNIRQAAAVNCAGQGPYATLQTTQPADGVGSVALAYTDGSWMDTVVLNVDVVGSKSGALGHGAVTGQHMGSSGTVNMTLFSVPQPGETLITRFGLQVHAGCLPSQPVGLWGSRPIEAGRVIFTSVSVVGHVVGVSGPVQAAEPAAPRHPAGTAALAALPVHPVTAVGGAPAPLPPAPVSAPEANPPAAAPPAAAPPATAIVPPLRPAPAAIRGDGGDTVGPRLLILAVAIGLFLLAVTAVSGWWRNVAG